MNYYKSKKHGSEAVFGSNAKVINTPDGDEWTLQDGPRIMIVKPDFKLPPPPTQQKPLPLSTPATPKK